MIYRRTSTDRIESCVPHAEVGTHQENARDEAQEAELRRLMYERIARGNALVEAEEAARRKWTGK